jgi:hypothetical protein
MRSKARRLKVQLVIRGLECLIESMEITRYAELEIEPTCEVQVNVRIPSYHSLIIKRG